MALASTAVWAGLLAGLNAGTTQFAMHPERWETRSSLPLVEDLLRSPLQTSQTIDFLADLVKRPSTSADQITSAFKAIGVVPKVSQSPGTSPTMPVNLPAELSAPVGMLLAGLISAQSGLNGAVYSLNTRQRAEARIAPESAASDDPFLLPQAHSFDVANRFDLARLAASGILAARSVDAAIPRLKSARVSGPFDVRWQSPVGDVIISSGNASFDSITLARTALLVRLGGSTRYLGPAASAEEGHIRIVLDLGGPVTVVSSGPAAGSGTYGLGLFYALGPGPHSADVGERSLGAAHFGVGYAAFEGDRVYLSSRRFGQGAAAYGVGVLVTSGTNAALRSTLAGQGFGGTQGAGLWLHDGDGLNAQCGFNVPDAREPLGSLSMGQGAGMGPRAFAAGGLGIASIVGNHPTLTASYFSQGSGYWHGLGALFIRGDDARVQSRRYGLGTGVHFGIGSFNLVGRRADVVGWGVGPGFAWDYGVGLFELHGDDAHIRSDWANGRSDLGGLAMALIEGDRNELSLQGFGTGSFSRSQAGYGLVAIRGDGVRLRASDLQLSVALSSYSILRADPWGALQIDGHVALDPSLNLPEPKWPPPQRDEWARTQSASSSRLLEFVKNEDKRVRLSRLLFSASAAILDPRPAQAATIALVGLPASDASDLAALLDADRFDELVWVRLAAASLGPAAARAAAREYPRARGARRAALLDWLKFGALAESLPVARSALRDADWRMRRQAAFVIGTLFDDAAGDEPGRRRFLRDSLAASAAPETLGRKHLSDLYSALALAPSSSADIRRELLAISGSPFDNVSSDAVRRYISEIKSHPQLADAFRREERDAAELLSRARRSLRTATDDADDEVAASALESLGRLGNALDSPRLIVALSALSPVRRQAAVAGLAHLGPAAHEALRVACDDPRPDLRALVASAAAQSWDAPVYLLVKKDLKDRSSVVRAAAVAALGATQSGLVKTQAELVPELSELIKTESDPGIWASATLALAKIVPKKP